MKFKKIDECLYFKGIYENVGFLIQSYLNFPGYKISFLHKGGTLKPPSPGLGHVDDINEEVDDITEQELEQQEVQNLLTTLKPISDVQLQLAGYTQEKDDRGKMRSLTICPTTPKRIKSIFDENNR
ncbi:hypothetical protein AVEN_185023-1 [Araneus ventricosus]|uniref:Uncharacterized protein n=1 Tax=Araneus ventricosus TaxID=182803 RepID=A0A4Y2BP95_ARAVE|nr:hypothetical protein AVEN_185023-1 [Araneus ventricosus]